MKKGDGLDWFGNGRNVLGFKLLKPWILECFKDGLCKYPKQYFKYSFGMIGFINIRSYLALRLLH